MKKRLRKKLWLSEFRQFGFEVRFSLCGHHADAEINNFLDSFILDVIEPRGLLCGGGGGKTWNFFVHPNGRRSASEDDREYLLRSLRGYTDVIDIEVDPLVDAWYPPDP